jgi:CRP/FNR family cyclic AMP-dependent transcriptional regulator
VTDLEGVLERLANIKLFEGLDSDRLRTIATMAKKTTISAGHSIITEGDEGDTLFVMLDGSVRIMKKTMQDELYTVVVLRASDNVYFGEVALVDSDKRSATVMAESDVTLLSLNRSSFEKLCQDDPWMGYTITMQIARKLSSSLRKMNSDVITLFEALVTEVEGGD